MGYVTWVSGMPRSRRHFEDITGLLLRSDFEPNQLLELEPLELGPTNSSPVGSNQEAESECRLAAIHGLANIGPE